jgi:hypothetical protein
MDRDKMSSLYRGPSIDASYLVSVHLAEGFQRRRLKCEKLTDDRIERKTSVLVHECPSSLFEIQSTLQVYGKKSNQKLLVLTLSMLKVKGKIHLGIDTNYIQM